MPNATNNIVSFLLILWFCINALNTLVYVLDYLYKILYCNKYLIFENKLKVLAISFLLVMARMGCFIDWLETTLAANPNW